MAAVPRHRLQLDPHRLDRRRRCGRRPGRDRVRRTRGACAGVSTIPDRRSRRARGRRFRPAADARLPRRTHPSGATTSAAADRSRSSTIRPSRSATARGIRAASVPSWETVITVMPSVAASRSISSAVASAGDLVKLGGRFVGEQQPRTMGDRGAHRHSLSLPAGELAGQRPGAVVQPGGGQQLGDARASVARRAARRATPAAARPPGRRSGQARAPTRHAGAGSRSSGCARERRHALRAGRRLGPGRAAIPAEGRCSPAMTRSRVVLPAPLGPSTQTASPRATVSVRPWSAAASPWAERCTQKTSRSSTAGSLIRAAPGRRLRLPPRPSRRTGGDARRPPAAAVAPTAARRSAGDRGPPPSPRPAPPPPPAA